jgi:serine/threonine protein kinase
MAEVYLARGPDGMVALKLVAAAGDPGAEQRFRHEAQLSASLRHPNVAQVLDVGLTEDALYFLAMELVHGATLREVLASAARNGYELPLGFGIGVVAAAAAGLHHAHERSGPRGPLGIVHRDVSPSNIMIGVDGCVKLIDFGIARSHVAKRDTARGMVKGKPGYMSPEQLAEEPVDRRSDIFSLGVVLFEATTQTRAFAASTEVATARRVMRTEIAAPESVRAGYPPELAHVVRTALARDPGARFATAEAMRVALAQAAQAARVPVSAAQVVDVMRLLFPVRARGTGGHPALVLDQPARASDATADPTPVGDPAATTEVIR